MRFFKRLALLTAIAVACGVSNAVAAESNASDVEHQAHHPAATKPVSNRLLKYPSPASSTSFQ
ncbi:hypothetical protein ACLFKU_35535 [Paraburkholderia sp. EG304]